MLLCTCIIGESCYPLVSPYTMNPLNATLSSVWILGSPIASVWTNTIPEEYNPFAVLYAIYVSVSDGLISI